MQVKVRDAGNSLIITLPSGLCKLLKIHKDTVLELEQHTMDSLILKIVRNDK